MRDALSIILYQLTSEAVISFEDAIVAVALLWIGCKIETGNLHIEWLKPMVSGEDGPLNQSNEMGVPRQIIHL